nr:putative nucleotidyltransferase, ribonuclease H [Tanacetum cinerariifolium]
MLRSCALEWTGNWDDYICLVEFGYNNSWHASIKCAPFEMLYGRKCRVLICWDQVGERVIEGPEMIEVTNAKVIVAKEKLKEALSPARGVRRFGIKGKLSPRFIRPFEILDRVVYECQKNFKGMSYDDIRPIFEAKFNSNVAFLLKTKEQIEEDENRALQRLNETPVERVAKRRKLDEEIWKTQRNVHGPAKVKGWKLLESCGVQIITFTTTQLILLVKRKNPLTKFTLDQMLNAVRLEVKEESEVSLELLSFGVDAAKELKKNMLSV